MATARPFYACPPPPAGGWTPDAFSTAADRAVARGYNGIRVEFAWARAQPKGPGPVEFGSVDRLVAAARAKKLEVSIRIDHAAAPAWVDEQEYGQRDGRGSLIVSARGGHHLVSLNAKQVRDWVAELFQATAARYKDAVVRLEQLGPHQTESAAKRPGGAALDHSEWSAKGFRAWLKARYVDPPTLNAAWDSAYASFDAVEPGEGSRRSRQADFHHFRYVTLGLWTESLRKAVHAGHPATAFAFRAAMDHWGTNLGALAFDLGRYVRAADVLLAEEAADPFQIAAVATAAELWDRRWAIEAGGTGALAPGEEPKPAEEPVRFARTVYALGGHLEVVQPLDHPAGRAAEEEVVKFLEIPAPPPRNNRRAVYVSAAEIQFWDGTDLEQARNLWMAGTDGGKKKNTDVISDGVFTGTPDVLKRYTAGIEIPFSRVIAGDARTALVQAAKNGVRLICHSPKMAGVLDEHGKPQPPLAG